MKTQRPAELSVLKKSLFVHIKEVYLFICLVESDGHLSLPSKSHCRHLIQLYVLHHAFLIAVTECFQRCNACKQQTSTLCPQQDPNLSLVVSLKHTDRMAVVGVKVQQHLFFLLLASSRQIHKIN